jgi:non-canonical purine NTP pyrophosphatase (RdgB/HAM1 family)
MKVNFITSSLNKVEEISVVLGDSHQIVQLEAGLLEIQSLSPHEIIREKLKAGQVLFPELLLMVEDTSFEVDALNGLPGPFIKFFQSKVDDQGIYEMARGRQPEGELTARGKVIIGLAHGDGIHFFEGAIEGTIVEQQGEGWGFDRILVPSGYDERLGTLGKEVKSQISHRATAAQKLKKYLNSLTNLSPRT